jgi:pyruvate/2-oxoglutarate dehydrogenase complex dihydrolipoamide dehydrogenase (E3) component
VKDHDVIIIGGGSAGYAAARTAREQGADVAIVDRGPLGGLCILRGCMPSKTLLRSSDVISLMRRAGEFGLAGENPRADLAAIMDRKDRLIREFADYRIQQLRGFTLYEDDACFLSPHELRVGDRTLTAASFVIATGSVASHVEIPGLDEAGYLTSDELLDLREQPRSMIVLGGGAVATEMAQFFCRIGTEVTLIQRSPHLLSCEDEDLALPVETRFRDEGMHLYTGTKLQRISSENGIKTAHFTHGTDQVEEKSASAEMILQALGRRPNVEHLGLEAAGVDIDIDSGVTVDAQMRTTQPHIFAIGDVNGLYEIVHIAVQQGEVAGFNAVTNRGANRSCEERLKTLVVFTDPAVATAGLREKECISQGIPYLAASYPFDDHGKSMCLGETHGHVKLMCDPTTGELIGAHIVGPEAGELIHELLAVMYFKGTVHDLLRIPHYHPTLAEIVTYPAEELAERLSVPT